MNEFTGKTFGSVSVDGGDGPEDQRNHITVGEGIGLVFTWTIDVKRSAVWQIMSEEIMQVFETRQRHF